MTDPKPITPEGCIKAECTQPEAADCSDKACYVPKTPDSKGLHRQCHAPDCTANNIGYSKYCPKHYIHTALLLEAKDKRISALESEALGRKNAFAELTSEYSKVEAELEASEKLVRELEKEKQRRIYYQDIVYHVCYGLDLIDGQKPGHGIVCGTIEEPNTDVFDRMVRLKKELEQLGLEKALLQETLEKSVKETTAANAELAQAREALKDFVDYYDQAGIGECPEGNDDRPDDEFDGDERFNVRKGRKALRGGKGDKE